jgi:RHS repeat-associated protein
MSSTRLGTRFMLALFVPLISCSVIQAQTYQATTDMQTGQIPFESYDINHIDSVNLLNGNLSLAIPLVEYPQLGGVLKLRYSAIYDSKVSYSYFASCQGSGACNYLWYTPGYSSECLTCYTGSIDPSLVEIVAEGMTVQGGIKSFTFTPKGSTGTVTVYKACGDDGCHLMEADSTGVYRSIDATGISANLSTGVITDKHGTQYFGYNYQAPNGTAVAKDAYGNTITKSSGGITDTMGRNIGIAYGPQNGIAPGCLAAWTPPGPNAGTLNFTICTTGSSSGYYTKLIPPSSGTATTTVNAPASETLSLPDGTSWQFQYGGPAGEISQVTLPTGGTISYAYGINYRININENNSGRPNFSNFITGKTVNDGAHQYSWNYTYGNTPNVGPYTIVTSPLGDDTVHQFSCVVTTDPNTPCDGFFETSVKYYHGSANATNPQLLRTEATTYNAELYGYCGSIGNCAINVTPATKTTTLDNGSNSESTYTYDESLTINGQSVSFGDLTYKYDYDFGGALLRKTANTYLYSTNSSYQTLNMLDRASSTTVYDASGQQIAQTRYGYDEGSSTLTGSLTSVQRWLNTTGTFLTTHYVYNSNGTPSQMTDPLGNQTKYFYSSTYNGAYLTQVQEPSTNGVAHNVSYAYDFNMGFNTSKSDYNGQTTRYSYDGLGHLYQIAYPDGGQTTFCYSHDSNLPCYTSTLPPFSTESRLISGSATLNTKTLLDSFGRVTQTQLNSDPNCPSGDKTDTTYDALGRIFTVSNSYCTTSDPTYGTTTYAFDALGRTTQVTQPDGNTVLTTYTGRATQAQDEGNGSQRVTRISQADGLGRLTSVCEVAPGPFVGSGGTSSPSLIGSGGTPVSCGQDIAATGFLTSYQFDALDNLLQVNQSGLNPRRFTYDSLSRLLTSVNPESGTICYGTILAGMCQANGFDLNGNLVTKTDARGIQTNFSYDALNRLLSKGYSDTTPGLTNTYDIAVDGLSITYPVGQLVKSATNDGKTATVNSYDQMGRIQNQWQCTPQNCGTGYFSLPYVYDFLGDITSAANGMSVTIGYGYNGAAELNGVTSTLSDANHPATLFSSATYTPFGAMASARLGNGASEARAYNTRLWLQSSSATDPTGGTATPGTGSVTISGSEQSSVITPATHSTGSFTIYGGPPPGNGSTIVLYVNGASVAATGYGHTSTTASVASVLTNIINGNSSCLVTATLSGSTINLTSKATGSAANYAMSGTPTSISPPYQTMAVSYSSGMTGGTDATIKYDTGTVSMSVNGSVASSYTYGQTDTASSVAAGLVSHLSSSFVNASASGSIITLTAKTTGASTNYPLSASVTYDTTHFSSPSFTAAPSGATLIGGTDNAIYSLTLGSYAPNGDILSANDTVNGNWSFVYDPFNRVVGANQNSGQSVYNYVYDIAGNRWQQNGPHTMNLTFTGNATTNNNRADGYSYDLAGNLLNDGTNAYTYDAENRIITAGTSSYIYDANGRRVRKTVAGVSIDFLYDLDGNQITEISSTGAWNRGEIYAGARHLATYRNGTTYFTHADWLGTERVRSNVSGGAYETCTSLVFGDWLTCSTSDASPMHFTGQEHDFESGLDNFGARHLDSSMGGFMSPDPENAGVTLGTPQSWNAYAYVLNNPLSFIDPSGLAHCEYHQTRDAEEAGTGTANANGTSGVNGKEYCEKHQGLWVEDDSQVTVTVTGKSDGPQQDATASPDPYLIEISRQLAPLNKLSDCSGKAVVHQIPLVPKSWLNKFFGTETEKATPAGKVIDAADKANGTLEKLSSNEAPAKAVWALKKAGLPALSGATGNAATKIVPKLAPYASWLKVGGYAFSAGIVTYETVSCYNKPGG